ETANVAGALDDANGAGDDCIADARAGEERPSLVPDAIVLERRGSALPVNRLGPRLDHKELAALAVLRPFDVHRHSIVLLDLAGPAREREDLVVVEHVGLPLGVRRRHIRGGARRVARVDHLPPLLAAALLHARPAVPRG